MSYISLSQKDRKDMLARIGAESIGDLFSSLPENIKLRRDLDVPGPMSEKELSDYFRKIASRVECPEYITFLGAGAYSHLIPSVVDYLSSRGEFISPYTPYQPEVSQGTLQVIFEFQTLICQLTGMDVSNASLYDGASGAAEAVLMSHRLKGRPKILVPGNLHPQYRQVIGTYVKNLEIEIEEVGVASDGRLDLNDLESKLDERTSAVICQSPNFFGLIEDVQTVAEMAHAHQALSVAVVSEAVSLGLLEPPGALGADIVTGEAQSLGLPVSFGGPYLGFISCREEFIRQFPGRIAGETVDVEGRRGFVLTLSTREQHIRRERATSNICTNQAWCAFRATVFMETMGKEGLREMAWHNVQKAAYAFDRLSRIQGLKPRFDGPFFNEFVMEAEIPWSELDGIFREKKIIPGLPLAAAYPELGNCMLFCVTELHRKEDIDALAAVLEEALAGKRGIR